MTDRVLDKFLSKRVGPSPGDSASPSVDSSSMADRDAADDLGCFGYLRGIRDRAVMLELRKRDGSIMAVAYAYLERAEFDPTDGITLHAQGRQIKITGRKLNAEVRPNVRLFHALTRHRVTWIQEAAEENGVDDQQVTIERITN